MKFEDVKSSYNTEIANYFKLFFESVYQDPISFNIQDFDHIPSSQAPIQNIKITQNDIMKAIKNLDINKGPGPHLIPPKFLRSTINSISSKFQEMFNR